MKTKRQRLENKLHNLAVALIDMENPAVYAKLGMKRYYNKLNRLNNKFHKIELELALIK